MMRGPCCSQPLQAEPERAEESKNSSSPSVREIIREGLLQARVQDCHLHDPPAVPRFALLMGLGADVI
ncbi:hypothetical protein NDU88_008429 [Pleurodeles waltl]|uniref:Uncharacterized protein n=1 Tax=Pleurodeles waltl TaxID=8319 RepID=A0AAV7RUM0_PLEWA|nr:hypothetical protein NDU88_008429 [Pleurodeles waltl]